MRDVARHDFCISCVLTQAWYAFDVHIFFIQFDSKLKQSIYGMSSWSLRRKTPSSIAASVIVACLQQLSAPEMIYVIRVASANSHGVFAGCLKHGPGINFLENAWSTFCCVVSCVVQSLQVCINQFHDCNMLHLPVWHEFFCMHHFMFVLVWQRKHHLCQWTHILHEKGQTTWKWTKFIYCDWVLDFGDMADVCK